MDVRCARPLSLAKTKGRGTVSATGKRGGPVVCFRHSEFAIHHSADASGAHVALLVDHDGDAGTPRQLRTQRFDAFGNRTTPPAYGAGPFAWRGQEGSVTDADGGLVYMQTRYYDPTIGRFTQGDSLALASLTTQGMNRFIYVENNPVNGTDPTGQYAQLLLALIFLYVFIAAFSVYILGIPLLGLILGKLYENCLLSRTTNNDQIAFLLTSAAGLLGALAIVVALLPVVPVLLLTVLAIAIVALIIAAVYVELFAEADLDAGESNSRITLLEPVSARLRYSLRAGARHAVLSPSVV